MSIQQKTEFEFTLPKGYVDTEGNVYKKGKMRLATAADEILPLRDPRVQQNPAYLNVIVLARVITQLGDFYRINTQVIESLFSSDFNYLQNFYREINEIDRPRVQTACPECGKTIEVPLTLAEAS